jgi:Uma2 family endonuclease
MPSPLTQRQAQWREIAEDPSLHGLPYKVETNERGQLILSPHAGSHAQLQSRLFQLLRRHVPEGLLAVAYAVATPAGVKIPDVVWMSPAREREMAATGDPSSRAPELCVEMMGASSTEAEMRDKRALYRDLGAEEVWIVSDDGRVRFFGADEWDTSQIAPSFPATVDLE